MAEPERIGWHLLRPRPPEPPPPGKAPPPPPPELTSRLIVGLVGALIAGLLSYLDTRIGQEAVADVLGGLGLGRDEGSWVTTAYLVGELAIVPLTPWLATALSPRRCFALAIPVAILSGAAVPQAPSFAALIACRFLQGVGDGMLIPLLLMTVLSDMTGKRRVWGLAVYAIVVNLPPTLAEPIAGLYTDHFTWKALFWENVLPGGVALAFVLAGLPVQPAKFETFEKTDYFGMFCLIAAAVMLTVGSSQGQRLDWFDSSLVVGMFAGAALFATMFVVHELRVDAPFLDLSILKRRNFSLGLVMFLVFNMAQLATVSVLPQFGTQIRGFREQQIGDLLIWFAVPEILLPLGLAWLLQHLDSRIVLASGLCIGAIGNYLSAYVTSDYAFAQLLPGQILLLVSWPAIIMGLALSTTSVISPQDTLTGSVLFNSMRNLASSVGSGIVGGIVAVRERVHSDLILQLVVPGSPIASQRTAATGGLAGVQAAVQTQAYVQAFSDTYGWIAVVMLLGIVIVFAQTETRVAGAR